MHIHSSHTAPTHQPTPKLTWAMSARGRGALEYPAHSLQRPSSTVGLPVFGSQRFHLLLDKYASLFQKVLHLIPSHRFIPAYRLMPISLSSSEAPVKEMQVQSLLYSRVSHWRVHLTLDRNFHPWSWSRLATTCSILKQGFGFWPETEVGSWY